jgi:hypothetical protein
MDAVDQWVSTQVPKTLTGFISLPTLPSNMFYQQRKCNIKEPFRTAFFHSFFGHFKKTSTSRLSGKLAGS